MYVQEDSVKANVKYNLSNNCHSDHIKHVEFLGWASLVLND